MKSPSIVASNLAFVSPLTDTFGLFAYSSDNLVSDSLF